MALQILFGDDEHTAADGPYNRVLKVRKWLYISSAGLLLLTHKLYSSTELAVLFPPIRLPEWLIGQALLVGLAYLLVQYILLSAQLGVTYDLIIEERLRFRRVEELSAARSRLNETVEQYESRVTSRQQAISEATRRALIELSALTARRQGFENELERLGSAPSSPAKRAQIRRDRDELGQAIARQDQAVNELKAEWDQVREEFKDSLSDPEVREAAQAFEELRKQNPASRRGYQLFELIIDLLRVLTPGVIAIASIIFYLKPNLVN